VRHSFIVAVPKMSKEARSSYFSLLHHSADEKLEMGLDVLPIIDMAVLRDQYMGRESWNAPNDASNQESLTNKLKTLDGLEISGLWNQDQSVFYGSYPIKIDDTGGYHVPHEFSALSPEAIHDQIDLAEQHGLLIGIAARASSYISSSPNSVIHADCRLLKQLVGDQPIVIETNGEKGWLYASINYGSEDIDGYFAWQSDEIFGVSGSELPLGTIVRHGCAPCYPSLVHGVPIKPLSIARNSTFLHIPSAAAIGIYFNREAPLTSASACFDENLEWCHTPDEDETLFQQSLADYELVLKPSKIIIRHDQSCESTAQHKVAEESDIDLYSFVPHRLAVSLSVVKENLPYDSLCVLISFLTGLASMLRLGTTVIGNELTDYKVPINFYTILRARSGRKKSPLQKLFVDQPASDVMLKIAQENDRLMKAWEEENRGKGASDKSAQPVPVDVRINDYTGEALVQALGKLDEVGRSVLIEREEISALFKNLNGYKSSGKGSDEQQLLELYDGGGFRSLRVGDKGRAFSRSGVNIYGTIQPEVLDGLLRNGDASGLWARFSFAAMPDMTKRLPTNADLEKLKAFEAAKQYLKDITSAVYDLPAVQYKLDSKATELFADYEFKKQEDAQSTKISAQAALYGKAAGKVLRFAGILHIVDIVVNKSACQPLISASTLRKAIGLVDPQDRWTLAYHAKLAGVTTDGLTPFQRRLHNIALKSKSPMSWSEIRQKMSSTEKKDKDVKDAEEAMSKLVALGLGEVTEGPNGGLYYKALKPLPA